MAFALTSGAFASGAAIPSKHTCEGVDVSPPLAWSGAPAGTRTFALIADDPDAPGGTWVHWVLFNIPGSVQSLPLALSKMDTPTEIPGVIQGKNDSARIGYGGPCPPPGKVHHYSFRIYALDAPLALRAGARKGDVEQAMEGHILGTAELIGTYERARR